MGPDNAFVPLRHYYM